MGSPILCCWCAGGATWEKGTFVLFPLGKGTRLPVGLLTSVLAIQQPLLVPPLFCPSHSRKRPKRPLYTPAAGVALLPPGV